MRIHFRTDTQADNFGWYTGRLRTETRRRKLGREQVVWLEILTPFRMGGKRVWWPAHLCDSHETPDWTLDREGRLVAAHHHVAVTALSPPNRRLLDHHLAERIKPLVREFMVAPDLRLYQRMKLLADEILGPNPPRVVPAERVHREKRHAWDCALGSACGFLAHPTDPWAYLAFLSDAQVYLDAVTQAHAKVRERSLAPKADLKALYEAHPGFEGSHGERDHRVPAAYQWPNPPEPDKTLDRYRGRLVRRIRSA